MSRPSYQPTDEQREMVSRLTGLLVSEEQIARDWMKPPCSVMTLRKHFRDELKYGRQRLASQLKDAMLVHARNGSIRAIAYLLDRLGDLPAPKRETEDQTPTQPIQIVIKGGLPREPPEIEGVAEVRQQ
jgi:hypothetical protein